MMTTFEFYRPTKIIFGRPLGSCGEVIARFSGRVLIVVGSESVRKSGVLETLVASLSRMKVQVSIANGITPNPTLSQILAIAEDARRFGPSAIVCLGGGSVMDAGKVIALAMTHTSNLWEYRLTGPLGPAAIAGPIMPIITIPTTGGTGSEISPASVISHNGTKEVIVSDHLYPALSIVDPELACSLPSSLSGETAFDALIQGVEAFVSPAATPFSDAFAKMSIRLAIRSLPKVINEPLNRIGRTEIAEAGLLSGFAIGLAGVGAIHALSDPLSGRFNLRHGVALATVARGVIELNESRVPSRFKDLCSLLDREGDYVGAGLSASHRIEELRRIAGIPDVQLRNCGASRDDLNKLADESDNPDMQGNPGKLTHSDVLSIFESVY
jgi:alcohol dehydrogenase class IV